MIIKGQSRGRWAQLAKHLLNEHENDRIHLHECRGTVSQSVEGALAEMEAQSAGGRSRKSLYHASISPEADKPLTSSQITLSADLLEKKLGLSGHPRLIVVHRKLGREHAHVVWSRLDRTGKLVSDGWNYAAHEQAARELEQLFGHNRVQGAHVGAGSSPKPNRTPKEYELRQAERSGVERQTIRDEIAEAWTSSENGEAFKTMIEAKGYRLARGDRRGFVVVDRGGEVHSLARILGVKTAHLSPKLDTVLLQKLPDVKTARKAVSIGHPANMHRLMIRTFNVRTGPNVTGLSVSASKGRSYSARRASIVSEFASKIADVCGSGQSPEEIAARIRRLRDEEAAALSTLRRDTHGQGADRQLKAVYRAAASQVTIRRPTTMRPLSINRPHA